MKRVVVTGIGAVTPLGRNINETWSSLIAGKSGITSIPSTLFSTEDLPTKIAGLVPGDAEFHESDMTKYIPGKDIKKWIDLYNYP